MRAKRLEHYLFNKYAKMARRQIKGMADLTKWDYEQMDFEDMPKRKEGEV